METIKTLAPQNVWRHFYELTQIPRPSGHLEAVRGFLLDFGKGLGLESFTDKCGNVVIRKPASPGMEGRRGVVLQGHMDMVPQKDNGTAHDFTKDPIRTVVDGEWVRACGTTLGADNGLGVAAIMAVLEDGSLRHGPLEALVTADEETGMYGAFGLEPGVLRGKILLNLDSEEEGELYIGCAGGLDVSAALRYREEPAAEADEALRFTVKGLRGGHSGLEIGEGRANANKLMARLVAECMRRYGARLAGWEGGNMRNAIPREATAVMMFAPAEARAFFEDGLAGEMLATWQNEYRGVDDGIALDAGRDDCPSAVMPAGAQEAFVSAILACHDGEMRRIAAMPDTVETSSNLAIVAVGGGAASVKILARSSCDSMKAFLAEGLEACFRLAGMEVETSGGYSGWQPDFQSPALAALRRAYAGLFGAEPKVKVVHAGLECGILGAKMPWLDMVSFGPTLRSPHSPAERAHIPSVARFYDFLVAALAQVPEE